MIAKAQADSVCAFFGNVEINFTLRSVFTNLPDGEFRMHLKTQDRSATPAG